MEVEDKLLIANIVKKAEKTYNKNIITNTNFLDPRQFKLIEHELKKLGYKYDVIKLNDDIEKVILLFLPSYLTIKDIDINEYISCIKIDIKKGQKLYHKDYMGAIYNIGIKKEYIGDIFVYEDNSACIFCTPKIAEYFKYNLIKIGKYEVEINIKKVEEIELPKHLYQVIEIKIPSNRIDNFASEVSKISRNKIANKISDGEIFLNYSEVLDKSISLNEKDIFSIRGIGKFKVDKYIGITKKGNLIFQVKKYI